MRMCLCVCVREKQRKREREREEETVLTEPIKREIERVYVHRILRQEALTASTFLSFSFSLRENREFSTRKSGLELCFSFS